jgi:GH25 family lysozyme M1 (1,4-beta-N-acetylmuramidase)
MPSTLQQKIIATARAEVGTREGRVNGHWNNGQKYSRQVPGLEWSNFQPWCATGMSWVALMAGATTFYPRTASCDAGGAWFKKRGRWSEYPAICAQVYLGTPRDLNHTGLVIAYGPDTITNIEFNTNDSGSREGNGVYVKVRNRRDPHVVGYGYPDLPGGITSADPAYSTGVKVTPPAPTRPSPPPAAGGLRVDGVDISHHQTGVTLTSLLTAHDAGVRLVYHKATQGEGFVDGQYATRRRLVAQVNKQLARRLGVRDKLAFGAYHYANPNVTGSDGATEARFFLSVAKPQPGDLRPVLDLEENDGVTRAELTRFVRDFKTEVFRQVGVLPAIYTQYDLDDSFGCPLWVARYHPANAAPGVPKSWKAWDLRQFSNGQVGRPSSIPGLGRVDLNTLPGKAGEPLDRYLIPATPATRPPVVVVTPPKPAPKPAPKPKPVGRTLRIGTWNLQRDRNPLIVAGELAKVVRTCHLDVLMLQECNDYRRILSKVPGYAPVAFYNVLEQAESMILVRAGLAITAAKAVQVTSDPDGTGPAIAGWFTTKAGGKTPAKHVTVATVEGMPFISGHTAPSVQNAALRATHPRQWRSYREWSLRTAGVLLRLGEKACIGADWNVDAAVDTGRQPEFPRAMLATAGMTRSFPAAGTADTRVIDGFGIKGGILTSVSTQRLGLGSDHRPVTATLTY